MSPVSGQCNRHVTAMISAGFHQAVDYARLKNAVSRDRPVRWLDMLALSVSPTVGVGPQSDQNRSEFWTSVRPTRPDRLAKRVESRQGQRTPVWDDPWARDRPKVHR